MGYTLKVGEAAIDWTDDFVRVDCDTVEVDDAPAFGEPTDRSNERWPSYIGWHDACDALGIAEIMFGTDRSKWEIEVRPGVFCSTLIADHPGAAPITPEHLSYIQTKVDAYKARHPDHIAKYPPLKAGVVPRELGNPQSDYVEDDRYDGNLCRAEWLVFWMRWALANCTKPVFVNR